MEKVYQISYYVPEDKLEEVKQAIFATGAGHLGNYDQCCWQTLGMGQFRPTAGSNPHIGTMHQLCQLPEYKVETVCLEENLSEAIAALIQTHPYETPAYFVTEITPHL